MYLMTQDGFTLLVMGFTGKKAMQFKEQYIKEFNEMKTPCDTRQYESWSTTNEWGD